MLKLLQQYLPSVFSLDWSRDADQGTAIFQTLFMTFWSTIFDGFLGPIFGVTLILTEEGGILADKFWCSLADKIVSIFRAIPFVILLASIAPVTQKIVDTQIGIKAALIPLTLGVFPFYARQVQVTLKEIDPGKIGAALSLGATTKNIIFKVYLKEARSESIRISIVTVVSLIGLTAMVGAVGAGGLGNTTISYDYSRFNSDVTLVATILAIILVFITQVVGDFLANRFNHQVR